MGDRYDDYPADLQKALDKQTKGEIKLNVLNPEEVKAAREAKQKEKSQKAA